MFDEKLFMSLCEKYQVEMSDKYSKPMLKVGNSVVELTADLMKDVLLGKQEQTSFSYKTSKSRIVSRYSTEFNEDLATAC